MAVSLLNSYSHYRDQKGTLNRKKHRDVLNNYIDYVTKKILDGGEVYLPKIGKFRIEGSKFRPSSDEWGAPNTNWGATKKLWEQNPELKGKQFVLYLNQHSNGYWYRLKWYPANRIILLNSYKMTPTEKFKKTMSKKIINDGAEYINQ